jgi:hypothetical protein
VIATAPTAPADHVVQVDDHHGGDHGGWGWGDHGGWGWGHR